MFGVWGLGFVWSLGFRVCLEFGVQGFVWDLGFRVRLAWGWGLGLVWVWGLGLAPWVRVQSSGFEGTPACVCQTNF